MFPDDPLGHRLEFAPNADLTADPATYSWQEVTADLSFAEALTNKRGSADEQGVTTSSAEFVLDNGPLKGNGRYFTDQPESDLWPYFDVGLPVRHSVNIGDGQGWRQRWVQYIAGIDDEWPSLTPYRVLTRVECAGLFRRLGQGKTLKAPLQRSVDASGSAVAGYWPFNEGEDAVQALSGLRDGRPFTQDSRIRFGEIDGGPNGPYAEFAATTTVNLATGATQYPRVSMPLAFDVEAKAVQVECWFRVEHASQLWKLSDFGIGSSDYSSQIVSVCKLAMGAGSLGASSYGDIHFYVQWNPNTGEEFLTAELWYADGSSFVGLPLNTGGGSLPVGITNGQWHHVRLYMRQDDATSVTYGISVDGNASYSLELVDTSRVLGIPQSVSLTGRVIEGANSVFGSVSIGELIVGTEIVDRYDAATGYVGEMAHERIERLCSEEGVPASTTATTSTAMGPQRTDSLLNLLRECEATDHGLLDDSQGVVGYTALSQLYNQDPALTIDANNRELFGPYRPRRDDQKRRNSVRATRPTGGAALVEDLADIAKRGLYDGEVSVNPSTDAVLADHAGWAVNLGTVEGKRRPSLTLDLLRAPAHAAPWLALTPGERASVTNLPRRSVVGDVDLMARGWTETFGPGRQRWKATVNCAPWLPYEVFVIEGAGNRGRVDSADSILTAAVGVSDTSLTLRTPSTRWCTTADDATQFPFDLEIGGERVTCTAISDTAATFVAAGTAAHASNASVSPGLPAGLVEGDALLVLAAIRNSGFGAPVAPAGYETLAISGNVAIFAKYAAAGEVAPTVTFTGGVANATTSAQCAAWRNCSLGVHRSASAFNSAPGQHIEHRPALLNMRHKGCVVIYAGWKQDDWTSVATVSGATEIGEPSSTTGDDQGLVWDYLIQTAAADVAGGSFTVTGGGDAISRSIVLALNSGHQVATVTRSINGVRKSHAASAAVKLWRASVLAL